MDHACSRGYHEEQSLEQSLDAQSDEAQSLDAQSLDAQSDETQSLDAQSDATQSELQSDLQSELFQSEQSLDAQSDLQSELFQSEQSLDVQSADAQSDLQSELFHAQSLDASDEDVFHHDPSLEGFSTAGGPGSYAPYSVSAATLNLSASSLSKSVVASSCSPANAGAA